MTDEPLWTVGEVATYLRKSERWVRGEYLAERLPCVRIGNSVRFHPEKIRALARGDAPQAPSRVVSLAVKR